MPAEYEVGAILEGKVTGITNFGAFVSLPGGKSGLVHISQIAHSYVSNVKDFLTEGQTVKVKIIRIDENNRINLSIKEAAPAPEGEHRNSAPRRPYNHDSRPQNQNPSSGREQQRTGGYTPRSSGYRSDRTVSAPPVQEKGPASFEDQLKKFMQESDSRQSDLNRGMEKRSSRRGNGRGRGGNNY